MGVDLPGISFGRDVASGDVTIDGVALADAGPATVQGVAVRLFTTIRTGAEADPATLCALPASIPLASLQAAGGRLPLGLNPATLPNPLPLVYTDDVQITYSVEPASGDVIDVAVTLTRRAGAQAGSSLITLATVQEAQLAGDESAVRAAAATAADDRGDLASARTRTVTVPWIGGVLTALLVALALVARRRVRDPGESGESGRRDSAASIAPGAEPARASAGG